MLDRIKALIAARQLSPSQFADQTTLPRPVVSHILSGRNKPSLEAAQKIMAAFPDVSIDWLLNGRGPMTSSAANAAAAPRTADRLPDTASGTPPVEAISPATASPATSPAVAPMRARAARTARPSAAADNELGTEPERPGAAPAAPQSTLYGQTPAAAVAWASPTTVSFGAPQAAPAPPAAPLASAAPPVAPPIAPPVALTPPAPPIVQQVIRQERVVRRILVFYSDGTFSDHRPLPPEETPFF
jgi:transcriptional regulator with XRE-family HTH domain